MATAQQEEQLGMQLGMQQENAAGTAIGAKSSSCDAIYRLSRGFEM